MKLVSTTPSNVEIGPIVDLPSKNEAGCTEGTACGLCAACYERARKMCVVLVRRAQKRGKKGFASEEARLRARNRYLRVLSALDILPDMPEEKLQEILDQVERSEHMHRLAIKGQNK